jgi:hypothetical protein
LVGGRRVSNLLVRPGKQETKKERERMFKKDTRKGISLGSIFALVASLLFVGGVATPASANTDSESGVVMDPQIGTSFTTLITEDFQLVTRLGNTTNQNLVTKLAWYIEKPVGVVLSYSQAAGTGLIPNGPVGGTEVAATATDSSVAVSGASTMSGTPTQHVLAIGLYSSSTGVQNTITSLSASITVHVTPYLDVDGDGSLDTNESRGDRQAIVFAPWSTLGATVDISAVSAGDVRLTGSSTIPSTVNIQQLTNSFIIEVIGNDYQALTTYGGDSKSSAVSGALLAQKSSTYVSVSAATTVPMNATSYSVRLYYGTPGQGTQVAVKNINSGTNDVSALSISPVVGDNVTADWKIRPNQTYTIKVHASTASGATSVSNVALTVKLSGAALSLGVREISVNGGASTTSYPTALSITTGTDGFASFTLKTFGFANENAVTVQVNRGNTSTSGTLTTYDPVYTVVEDNEYYAVAPGTALVMGYTVEDQWGVASARTDQRLKVTRASTTGFNYAETTSYVAVSAGVAKFTYTGQPATATGSTTVTVTLERQNSNNGTWATDSGSAAITTDINVTSTAAAFGTGLAASYAASVSYFSSTVSWTTVTGKVNVTGSSVVVTGDASLIFRASADLPTTTSGGITVVAGSGGTYTFQVTSLLAGTKTITLKSGTATTTSQLVMNDARSDFGSKITWDTTTIEAGKTRVITGTLTDANGNPVDTTAQGSNTGDSAGTASIVVTYTGTAGIVVGTMPTETDENGKFKVSVLTAAADSGTLTLTAVYMPQGASTVAAKKVTSVQSVTVTPAATPEVNAVIGSFNGRWAVRVENAKGSVVSVKAGNRWVKFTSLNNNYLFSRKSVVGRTIAVSVWVDGELQNSQTITIK